jgi:multidrug efflux pump subunit AcrA (membrane-fusion protein)
MNALKSRLGVIALIGAAVLIGIIALAACGGAATPTPEAIPVVVDDPAVIVEGRLNPAASVSLSFQNGGEIAMVLMEEGDWVPAGQVLIRLADSEQARAAVATARLELASAQLALSTLKETAPLVAAQHDLELANARDALHKAERKWTNQQQGNRASSVTVRAAEAELALAEDAMEHLRGRNYEGYSGYPDGDTDEAQGYKDYAAAYQRYQAALRNVNWYTGHPTEIQQGVLDAELALAQAQVAESERRANAWAHGPDSEELAVAEAWLANAQAQLEAAQAALADLEIVAPISGTVTRLSVKEGELATAGQVAAELADLSGWKVTTENLTEIDLPQIALDQPVQLTFDALPELTLPGVVDTISPGFEMKSGDVVYTVEIDLLDIDPGLQWGMTTVVTFDVPETTTAMSESAGQ